MKNKEAIEALKWKVAFAKEIGESHVDCVYVEALDLAINALENQTTDGDLIRRSVLDEIRQLYKDYQPNLATEVIEFGDALEKLIDNAPTVPERDYSQGWHDAITKALNEAYTITTEDGSFKVVQTETLEGLGMSMSDNKGGANNEKTDK